MHGDGGEVVFGEVLGDLPWVGAGTGREQLAAAGQGFLSSAQFIDFQNSS